MNPSLKAIVERCEELGSEYYYDEGFVSIEEFKAIILELCSVIEEQQKALTADRESPRELLALMSEGEGSDAEVYQIMAKVGLKKMDEALDSTTKRLDQLGEKIERA